MRLFYLINEPYEGYQVGYRDALDKLVQKGVIESYIAFPFMVVEKELRSWEQTLSLILEEIKKYQPNLILIAHIGNRSFPASFMESVKKVCTEAPIIGYDERDVFGYFQKPLPNNVIKIAKCSDIVFLVAAGSYADRFRNAGCKNVCYLPHVTDTVQFGKPWIPTNERLYDVVMIGNYVASRVPFRTMPGAKERYALVKQLSRFFRDKFAVFGRGWEGLHCNKGPIPFNKQEEVLRTSWISIGYDHFPDLEFYFSDRLPIALISGVAHVTKKTKGLENLFTDKEHCMFFDSVEEGVEVCRSLVKAHKSELISLGSRGEELVRRHFTEEIRMQHLISKMISIKKFSS